MRLLLVLGVIGNVLRIFSLAFLAPIGMAMYEAAVLGREGEWRVAGSFGLALFVSAAIGWFLGRWFERTRFLHRAEAMAVVSGTWLAVALVGGVPYVILGMSPVNAFFESMSGFTTTGATIIQDFSAHGRAFYLWRAMTQWFGGLGVIALFVVVLPRLGIAGRQLFFAEASGAPSEGISPQVRSAARRLWILYVGLTGLLVALLVTTTSFSIYEGVVHAFTTLSAGGFSPSPTSIAGYDSPHVEWILIVFMVISGTSYPLQYRAIAGDPKALLKDGEFLAYLGLCVFGAMGLAWVLAGGAFDLDTLRTSAFQVTSLASSTGYASTDYELWGQAPKMLLIVVMVIGGCAGSACGGAKVVRYLLLFKFLGREVTQTLHPRAVRPLLYKGRAIAAPVMRAVATLVVLYLVGYLLFGVAIVLIDDVSMDEGMSASLACMGNIGPAYGRAGPMGSFAHFSVTARVLLTISMWLGRLEIMAILALFHPEVWRNIRLRRASDGAGAMHA